MRFEASHQERRRSFLYIFSCTISLSVNTFSSLWRFLLLADSSSFLASFPFLKFSYILSYMSSHPFSLPSQEIFDSMILLFSLHLYNNIYLYLRGNFFATILSFFYQNPNNYLKTIILSLFLTKS